MKKIKLCLLSLALLLTSSQALAYYELGSPTGYVNDYTGVLNTESKNALETSLATFEQSTQHEVAVVLIDSLQGDYIENFANELFRDWGIGQKDVNNGVLFLAAISDREMRIEVGYGLEGALTDLESSWIIDGIKPFFRDEDYAGGVKYAADEIMAAIQGEVVPEGYGESDPIAVATPIVFFLFYIFMFFSGFLARSKRWWPGAVLGLIAGIILAIATFWAWNILIWPILGGLFDYTISKFPPKKGKRSFWSGGGWSSGGGSSGGFGGFGGGSSGGGGASGRW
ncbi:MAG: TPM domain-containing protein [Candidatus Gracilibacteria bacterium]|nr:TPM domain-containing protein [Candidatus Gracilibacteria bacterium]